MSIPLPGPRIRGPRLAAVAGAAALVLALIPGIASAAPAGGFASDYNKDTLSQFTFGSDMTLTSNGSVPSGAHPWFESVTPNGKTLYVANFGDGTISQYSVSSTGSLTPLSPATVTSDPSLGVDAAPVQVAVSPDGHNAYVANSNGSVSVFDIGGDGTLSAPPAETITAGVSRPYSVAVSPDGASVYVGDRGNGAILEYNRASNGTLTPKPTASISSGAVGVNDLAITPNGKYLYQSDNDSSTISQFSIESGGQLAPLAVPTVATGLGPYAVIVSPNGKNAYASTYSEGNTYQYGIAANGELAPLTPPFVAGGRGLPWMTASGTSLYAPEFSTEVYQYDVSSTGALSPKSPATAADSTARTLWGFVIPPDQGPVASFTSKVGKVGKASKFDGSGSSDSDGTVVSYHWSFGDGTSQTTSSPKVSHTYKKAGKHTVTLTVIDDSGCSTSLVFTGQTAYCNPGKAASKTVKVSAALKPLRLTVSPNTATAGRLTCYAFRATSHGHGVGRVSVRLAGHRVRTSHSGRARLCLALSKGSYTARASKSGYAAAHARISVAAAPAFTG